MTKLSRSKIDLFTDCSRCFWLEVKHGIRRPSFPPYTINNAIDYLLKQEFDIYRERRTVHPIMKKGGVDAVPFEHPDLSKWRHNFTGIRHEHEPSGFLVFGAVDDVWVAPDGTLFIVDYKATGAREHNIYDSYKRQMEIYQWLFRQNNFTVSPVGYFVFARVNKGEGFAPGAADALPDGETGILPFHLFLESYSGDDSWIPDTLARAAELLKEEKAPTPSEKCEHCAYRKSAAIVSTKKE